MTLLQLILLASGLHSTTYGYGEYRCGPVGKARACAYGATTASGEVFDPNVPTAAIAAPFTLILRPMYVRLRIPGGKCHRIRINDKMHARWIGTRGFDLSAAAVRLLTGRDASPTWSSKVEVCK